VCFQKVKFGSNNCLTNNFRQYEFQLSMLSSSKVSFWKGRFGFFFFFFRKTPKFAPNVCLTNNFLHCEFQPSMLSSSKILFTGGWHFVGVCHLPGRPQIWFKQLSHKQVFTWWVSTFYTEQFKNFILGVCSAGRLPNLV